MKTATEQSSTPSAKSAIDELFPAEIVEAAQIDSEYDRIAREIEKTTQIKEDAERTLESRIVGADLLNDKELTALRVLRDRQELAPLRIGLLEDLLEETRKRLRGTSYKAGIRLNGACQDAARGNQELAAQEVVGHFSSIQDARQAAAEMPVVKKWLKMRVQSSPGDGANMQRVVTVAREVYPELARLREKLGGEIPSASVVNAF